MSVSVQCACMRFETFHRKEKAIRREDKMNEHVSRMPVHVTTNDSMMYACLCVVVYARATSLVCAYDRKRECRKRNKKNIVKNRERNTIE